MANPQPQDGYVRIANELQEAYCKAPLSGEEFRVLLAIIRLTWGYQLKEAEIPQSKLTKLTGIQSSARLSHITRSLRDKNIITKSSEWGKPTTYALNKDYDTWTIALESSTAKSDSTVENVGSSTVENDNSSTVKIDRSSTVENDNSYKDSIKESIKDSVKTGRNHPFAIAWVRMFSPLTGVTPSVNQQAYRLQSEIDGWNTDDAIAVLSAYNKHIWQDEQKANPKSQPKQPYWFKAKIAEYLQTGKLPGALYRQDAAHQQPPEDANLLNCGCPNPYKVKTGEDFVYWHDPKHPNLGEIPLPRARYEELRKEREGVAA